MKLSPHINPNPAEKSHVQPFRRRRKQQLTGRQTRKATPLVWLWVTMVLVATLCCGAVVVQAHQEDPVNSDALGEKVPDSINALDPEVKEKLDEFLAGLKDYSYLDLIVKATNDNKKVHANSNRGPPVMIGRRRSLLEHMVHHRYSYKYLDHLKEQQKKDESEKKDDTKLVHILEAMKAYLYLTPNDARVKANPQRQLHNAATSNSLGLPPFPNSARKANVQLLKDMFYHAYNSYMEHAFPAAELLPLTCQPGTFDLVRLPALTLIDTLDTLLILGDVLEFAKSVERLRQFHQAHQNQDGTGGIFSVNQNVSVFETTIRVLGGLLSAHQMAVAYLKTTEALEEESTLKMPPIFLKDVFTTHLDDEYLQTPESVRLVLEQHELRHDPAACPASGEGEEQPPCAIRPESPPPRQHATELGSDGNNDWKDHCGAGILALEDCASAKSKPQQYVNHTTAHQERRLKLQEPQWEYDGFLLDLAVDIGDRLMPAFETRTGIPYGTVNLLSGVPTGETTIASLAGGGTLSLEFELLSRLTGNVRYGQAAKLAIRALWLRRSPLHLLGKHIDIQRGTWTESLSGIGSNSDSFLEYLLKHYLLFPEEQDFWIMLQAAYTGIFQDSRLGEWYADVDMKTGKQAWPKGLVKRVFESLMAFYPGMQSLMGELVPAARSLNSFFMVREFLGFLPERFSYSSWKVDGGISSGAAKYLLRPELLESCYFMHRATRQKSKNSENSGWQWAADFSLHHLEQLTRAKCGYASVRSLSPASGNLQNYQRPDHIKLTNEMPSFFLSETIKYLYLTFDDENIIHKDKDRDWIFTTEAHPIHYVPPLEQKAQANEEESPSLKASKERLRKKLNALKQSQKPSKSKSSDGALSAQYMAQELWTDSTSPKKYRNSIKDVVDEINVHGKDRTAITAWHPVRSFFGEKASLVDPLQLESKELMYQENDNLAHMAWGSIGLGNGYGMKKACPNIFAPELSWMHALSGGALDYTDIYVSAFSEADGDYPSSDSSALLVTSAEALSVHGSGVYLGNMDAAMKHSDRCDIARGPDGKTEGSTRDNSKNSPRLGSSQDELVQHVELTGVGSFEISAFPEGSGFFMRQLETGESITATFIMETEGEAVGNVTLMVYASMPRAKPIAPSPVTDTEKGETTESESSETLETEKGKESAHSAWKLVGPKLTSFFKKRYTPQDASETEMDEPKRAVVIADLKSNSFHCHVNVVRRSLHVEQTETPEDDDVSMQEDTSSDVVVATYPCAPALFGPTHITKLLGSGGAFVEQVLATPEEENEFGCGSSIEGDKEIPTATPRPDDSPQEQGHSDNNSSEGDATEADEKSCENRTVQLVQRGHCSFYAKAANQRKDANADGVIVINNEDDELFIMSNGGDEDVNMREDDLPVTVLVTGLDGEDMLELLESEGLRAANDGKSDSYMLAQISIFKQEQKSTDTDGSFKVDGDDVIWPIVRGTEEALQIFAEGGWGIHAVRKDGGSIRDVTGSSDLQLFLLRHSD